MSNTAIAAAPFVALAEPYLTAIATAAAPLLVAWGVSAFSRWTGIKINAAYEAQVEKAAATEAGKAVAAASDNLASARIDVGSPVVAEAVNAILASPHLKDAIHATGATPARVGAIVAGEIGKLQASMTAAPAAPPRKGLS